MNETIDGVKVGEGATLIYPQDSYPYVITRISESGKTAWARPLKTVSLATGHAPARHDGPWPVWSHTYTPEELVSLAYSEAEEEFPSFREIRITLTATGWKTKGTPVELGKARYHRNYSY
jgi:hypothetical protein